MDCAEEDDEMPESELPEVAPVAAMRASRSAAVVQVMLVPAELTSGRAAQLFKGSDAGPIRMQLPSLPAYINPPPHEVRTNLPLTHCAN